MIYVIGSPTMYGHMVKTRSKQFKLYFGGADKKDSKAKTGKKA